MAKKDEQHKSTQSFLKISEIKGDTAILDTGGYLAVVAVSSTNFALKSTEEQNAMIYGYQNFLNSIDFEIQILMQSRKMDIHVYLEAVHKQMERQTNELLRVQTQEYIQFITKLVENASIMNKSFYIIITHSPGLLPGKSKKGFFSMFSKSSQAEEFAAQNTKFESERLKMQQKINTVIGGMAQIGLKAIALNTEALTELFYNSYNLDSAPLIDASKLSDINLRS